jgi:hypothetical protein
VEAWFAFFNQIEPRAAFVILFILNKFMLNLCFANLVVSPTTYFMHVGKNALYCMIRILSVSFIHIPLDRQQSLNLNYLELT